MTTLTLQVELAAFAAKLDWVALKLESRDAREGLGDLLLDRLVQTVNGLRSKELFKFGAVTAFGAGDLRVRVEVAGVLEEVVAALRALGFEFHDQPFIVG